MACKKSKPKSKPRSKKTVSKKPRRTKRTGVGVSSRRYQLDNIVTLID